MICGIDPGLTGAVALLHDDGQLDAVWDMPMIGSTLDVDDLWASLMSAPSSVRTVAVEKVGAMPKQGVATTWTFAYQVGRLHAVIDCMHLRREMVLPREWKGSYALNGKPKDDARRVFCELWPQHRELVRRKKDIDRAEAALIAEHVRRTR